MLSQAHQRTAKRAFYKNRVQICHLVIIYFSCLVSLVRPDANLPLVFLLYYVFAFRQDIQVIDLVGLSLDVCAAFRTARLGPRLNSSASLARFQAVRSDSQSSHDELNKPASHFGTNNNSIDPARLLSLQLKEDKLIISQLSRSAMRAQSLLFFCLDLRQTKHPNPTLIPKIKALTIPRMPINFPFYSTKFLMDQQQPYCPGFLFISEKTKQPRGVHHPVQLKLIQSNLKSVQLRFQMLLVQFSYVEGSLASLSNFFFQSILVAFQSQMLISLMQHLQSSEHRVSCPTEQAVERPLNHSTVLSQQFCLNTRFGPKKPKAPTPIANTKSTTLEMLKMAITHLLSRQVPQRPAVPTRHSSRENIRITSEDDNQQLCSLLTTSEMELNSNTEQIMPIMPTSRMIKEEAPSHPLAKVDIYIMYRTRPIPKFAKTQTFPKKQGALYSLDLGKNNGPYLAKDIMLNNSKSINLLVGSEVISSHLSMVKSLQRIEINSKDVGRQMFDQKTNSIVKFDQRYKTDLSSSDNIAAQVSFLEMQVQSLRFSVQELVKTRRGFKQQLEQLQQTVNQRNIQNMENLQPVLKDFHLRIKQTFSEQKNESYLVYREIDQLRREKSGLLQQILFCQKKVMYLQKQIGVVQELKTFNIDEDLDELS